jgi:para-aminobenzoate synthetase/4-amino-4-deoxychorismate lyase
MRFDPLDGIVALERHIARLGKSARAFGFAFDRHEVRNELHAATFRLAAESRVRLLLSPSGAVAIEARPIPPAPTMPIGVRIVPLPVDPSDCRLAHKTSDRTFYDRARIEAGTFEVLFVRPDGLLTEGSFTNLFVRREGLLVTPPLARGLLPGILRETLLDSSEAIEGDLTADDLTDGFYVGNALRGLIEARLL